MTKMYLIAHKVRGEAAFDIAERMKCPICDPIRQGLDESSVGCEECSFEGYWWIIPTSGHRAYPYWFRALNDMELNGDPVITVEELPEFEGMWDPPPDWPDHYQTHAAKGEGTIKDLLSVLGLRKSTDPIRRRV
jgi:hypothetical protein